MLFGTRNYVPIVMGVVLMMPYFVNAKLLNVEFSGFVDAESTNFQQFCTAMWVTFSRFTWEQAITYCNSTTPAQAQYEVYIIREDINTVEQNVNITVPHFAAEIQNLTLNLQYSGFLYTSENVTNILDVELNKTLSMVMTSLIFFFISIFNIAMCIKG